jgi:urea transport system substrate-binding protein
VGTIPIGVLHSLTGTMAISEQPLVDSVQLAVDEVNAAGGVLGRPLEAVVVDGASDPEIAASHAEGLITEIGVPVIFGCWTSACRKAVKPVVERHGHLLVYPLQYEGLERSPNILYTGAAPNQQIIPGVRWALENLGQRFFLVGSDYLFPRIANMMIRDLVSIQGCRVLGERYLPLNSDQVDDIVAEIGLKQPEVIVNTINGRSNRAFFRALRANAATAAIPVMSFSVSEAELAAIGEAGTAEHYAVWSYFQTVDTPANHRFVERFQQRFGSRRVVDAPMESAYIGVLLWAQAVRDAGSLEPAAVRDALGRQSLDAPEGIVSVARDSGHLWKTVRIGKAQSDGQFHQVWDTEHPIRPEPFPNYRSRREWRSWIQRLTMTAAASGLHSDPASEITPERASAAGTDDDDRLSATPVDTAR